MSKRILDRIVPIIKAKLELTQWRNSYEVIEWFKAADKKGTKFLKLDIDSYYPSIDSRLLEKALEFARHVPKPKVAKAGSQADKTELKGE